ncbi:uncharacterized protein PRCAT00000822001 [Priceomyces carsonii]|uniref:uncharacterized protein n=1 Tax=Priceomyces carsonii TaxID=28549 RepID=UPI002EDB9193|nr:unnamed protein product [Priceomyces carsonii]
MAFEFDFSRFEDNPAYKYLTQTKITYQKYLDQSVPYTRNRWIGSASLLAIFLLRIFFSQGWYIICYGLGIYLLNLFLAFLTPKFDPSLEQEMKSESIEEGFQDELESTQKDEDFRPFIRKLPEFTFWYNGTRATLISLFLTAWNIFDIPVFWPILLMYFIILFTLTMRKQIQHMMRYNYLPFDFGKARYRRN